MTSSHAARTEHPILQSEETLRQDIKFVVHHGFVLGSLENSQVICFNDFDKRFQREPLASIQSMTLADLHDMASRSIQTVFNINTEKCRKENGGKGLATRIYVTVDIDGHGDNTQMTRMKISSERVWEVSKLVIGAGKGVAQVECAFAVDRGTVVDRWVARHFGLEKIV